MEFLSKNDIPLKNIVGLGVDNCSTLMGASSGFQARLRSYVPDLYVAGCSCHSLALAANHAAEVIDPMFEELLRDVSSYFSRSPKRQRELVVIQERLGVSVHQVLRFVETRWLSRKAVIDRLLEQYDCLLKFFEQEHNERGIKKETRNKQQYNSSLQSNYSVGLCLF